MTQKTIIQKLNQKKTHKIYYVRQDECLTLILICNKTGEHSATIKLVERGAKVNILGIIIGNRAHVIKLNTLQIHQASHTTSTLLVKSILQAQSKFAYTGNILIKKGAQRADAYQRNENLMLSTKTEVTSRPILEIQADDVKCKHGATISSIDQEKLFYLTSRGLSKSTSEKLIIQGFLQNLLDKITDKCIKDRVEKEIQKY